MALMTAKNPKGPTTPDNSLAGEKYVDNGLPMHMDKSLPKKASFKPQIVSVVGAPNTSKKASQKIYPSVKKYLKGVRWGELPVGTNVSIAPEKMPELFEKLNLLMRYILGYKSETKNKDAKAEITKIFRTILTQEDIDALKELGYNDV